MCLTVKADKGVGGPEAVGGVTTASLSSTQTAKNCRVQRSSRAWVVWWVVSKRPRGCMKRSERDTGWATRLVKQRRERKEKLRADRRQKHIELSRWELCLERTMVICGHDHVGDGKLMTTSLIRSWEEQNHKAGFWQRTRILPWGHFSNGPECGFPISLFVDWAARDYLGPWEQKGGTFMWLIYLSK